MVIITCLYIEKVFDCPIAYGAGKGDLILLIYVRNSYTFFVNPSLWKMNAIDIISCQRWTSDGYQQSTWKMRNIKGDNTETVCS